MSASPRARPLSLGAEAALAFGAATAAFALIAVSLAAAGSVVVAVLIAAVAAATVVVALRRRAVAYAVPVAMAGLIAFDWYQLPPTHPHEFPDAANLADLLAYLGVAVVIGLLAAHAGVRAEGSEVARSALADEQSALRRVATLVASEASPADVFSAVAREVGQLLGVDAIHMGRYAPDGVAVGVAAWSRAGAAPLVASRSSVAGDSVSARVLRTGRPARMDSYADASGPIARMLREQGIRSSVGAPITVDQELWGVMIASSREDRPLPADTERRIAAFSELVATAISNTEARVEVARLADEQAALRRVATLVARAVAPDELFGAATAEAGRLLGADLAGMVRYDGDAMVSAVATWAADGRHPPVRSRWPLDGDSLAPAILVRRGPARIDDWDAVPGAIAEMVRRTLRVTSSVGSPIVVEDRVWGALFVHSRTAPLPPGTESRLGDLTDLVATAILNIQARADLAESRARVVAAADAERRRVVRDLHDGAQQRLVHTVITLKLARRALDRGDGTAPELVAEATDHAERATVELRELAHGILPAVLTRGGLRAGVEALGARMPVPVEIDVCAERLPPAVESTAYFVVAEALTNVAKHADAERAVVAARVEGDALRVDVRDDGVGGARRDGTGLVGLGDRLAVLDGRLRVESPAGGGTLVTAMIPVAPD